MKECVYGWYPPAREVLKSYEGKLAMDAYSKDSLYGLANSRFADKRGASSPGDHINSAKWRASPQQVRKHKSWSRASSRASQVQDRTKASNISLEIRGHGKGQGHKPMRSQSAVTVDRREDVALRRAQSSIDARPTPEEKLFATKVDPRLLTPTVEVKVLAPASPGVNFMRKSYSQGSQRPSKAWNMKTEETSHIPDFQTYLKEMSDEPQRLSPHPPSPAHSYDVRHGVHSQHEQHFRKSIATPEHGDVMPTSAERQDRIKSATMYRPRMCTHRPVKSASSVRRTPMVVTPDVDNKYDVNDDDHDTEEEKMERQWQLNQMVNELTRDYEAPDVDELMPPRATIVLPDPDEELGVEYPLDYDEQLDRHGWRMQVHGDPLNLKRPCIAKRLPYTETVPVRVVPPDPPKARGECYDTYFLNTIPRRPMSFVIHKEWASEVLHAKRMALQKRDGDTYKYKTANFSFAY